MLINVEFSRQIFEKYSDMNFHKNPSSGSRVAPCKQTDRHDELTVAFRNFTEAPKKVTVMKVVFALLLITKQFALMECCSFPSGGL